MTRKKQTTKKWKKQTGSNPLDTDLEQKVIAVQFNAREMDTLREVLEAHQAKGSRVTVSQLIRWAVNHADFSDMPLVP